MRAEKLYFFQFPSNFPRFVAVNELLTEAKDTDDGKEKEADSQVKKKVSFSEEDKPSVVPVATEEDIEKEKEKQEVGL